MFDINKIRADFPMLNGVKMQDKPLVYLDNGATALKPQPVIDAVVEYYTNYTTNAHRGDYELSHRTDSEYEETRDVVAKFINASRREEIVFTSGTTHSMNIIAEGFAKHILNRDDVILITEAEHASNVLPWFRIAQTMGVKVEYVDLDDKGQLSMENLKKALHPKVKVVSLAHVSNVLGYVLPIKEITKLVHDNGAIMVVDGAQSVPHMPVDVQDLDIDFLAFSSHKMSGPSGVGVLYGKFDLLVKTDAYNLGGGMNTRFDTTTCYSLKKCPFKFEAGTPNIEGTIGFKAAIKYLDAIGMENIHNHEKEIRKYAIDKLSQIEGMIIYNIDAEYGPITFNIDGVFSQDVATHLNTYGVAVRSGTHCAKLLPNVINTPGTVRASLYYYNNFEDIDRLVEACATAKESFLDAFFN